LATEVHSDAALLGLASQLDEHTLGVWREAAASLAEECPPTLTRFRWRVEEDQRASCAATRSWSESRPSFGPRCAVWVWPAGGGVAARSPGCEASLVTAAPEGNGPRGASPTWTPSSR
jgi:hypothetical protein